MSAWKLVEAVAEDSHVDSVPGDSEQNNRNNNRINNSNGRGNGRGGGRDGRGRGRHNRPQLSQQDRNYLAYMAVQQIEYIFTTDNLCMDTYIRSYMDEAGYVPVALVCGYPHVAAYGAIYADIVKRLQEVAASESSVIEIDSENETIRLRLGWELWLMPNALGGRGVPLYVKQPHVPRQHNSHHNNSNRRDHQNKTVQQSQPQQCFDPNAADQQQFWPTLAEQMQLQQNQSPTVSQSAAVTVSSESS